MRSDIKQRISIGDRVTIKQRRLNKLTPLFKPTPSIVIYTKGALKLKLRTAIT